MLRLLTVVAISFGVGCAAAPSPVEPHPERIRWAHEPVVGVEYELARGYVGTALTDWGWGIPHLSSCDDSDICITAGGYHPDRWGEASWPVRGNVCTATIRVVTYVVITHELGHCFGLGHSTDERSVMWPTAPPLFSGRTIRWITLDDRRALRRIQLDSGL